MLTKNNLTNLSELPQQITRTWEFTITIPHWITAFFHIERGLLITFKVTILAHQMEDFYNTFCIEISLRCFKGVLYPHIVESLRIVLGYLWPNPYYQVEEEEIICALSRVSLNTGVTSEDNSTYADTPSLPSTPEILPQVELPVPPNHFTSGLQVPSELPSQSIAIYCICHNASMLVYWDIPPAVTEVISLSSLCTELISYFSLTDTITGSEWVYNSIMEIFEDPEEWIEVNDLLIWWNR